MCWRCCFCSGLSIWGRVKGGTPLPLGFPALFLVFSDLGGLAGAKFLIQWIAPFKFPVLSGLGSLLPGYEARPSAQTRKGSFRRLSASISILILPNWMVSPCQVLGFFISVRMNILAGFWRDWGLDIIFERQGSARPRRAVAQRTLFEMEGAFDSKFPKPRFQVISELNLFEKPTTRTRDEMGVYRYLSCIW